MQHGQYFAIAEQFTESGQVIRDIRSYGSGNINDTYLVTWGIDGTQRFILQCLNRRVFPCPERIMGNMRILTEHIHRRMKQDPPAAGRRWEIPNVLLTGTGKDHWLGADGSFWRALSFIDGARSYPTVRSPQHALEVGYALGRWHRLTNDLDPNRLADTLPGFHVTPAYLRHFDAVLATTKVKPTPEIRYCLGCIEGHRDRANVLENAKARGKLPVRPVHGDPKVDNVMMDPGTGRAVAVVDLDTVKPGLIQHDIGDCLRSACNPPGEETEQRQSVHFDVDLARAVLTGYLEEARRFLTDSDIAYFYDAILLIAFELGLRFFTDHLAGDIYFKVKHRGQNLRRAMVQFQLTTSIKAQETSIHAILRDLK